MKRNSAVKKISSFLNLRFEDIAAELKSFDQHHIQFELVTSTDVDVIARGLVCRDWRGRNKPTIKDEILRSSVLSISGIDFRRPGSHNFKKAFFIPDKPLIVVKKTTIGFRYKEDKIEYKILVYKPGKPLPDKTDYFDLKREYTFHLKWWDNAKTEESL